MATGREDKKKGDGGTNEKGQDEKKGEDPAAGLVNPFAALFANSGNRVEPEKQQQEEATPEATKPEAENPQQALAEMEVKDFDDEDASHSSVGLQLMYTNEGQPPPSAVLPAHSW